VNLLADRLLAAAAERPDSLCIAERGGPNDGLRWSYADFAERSAQFAHVLVDRGVQPGDRVCVQVDKCADAVALHVACVRAGAVYVPMNSAYTPREVNDLVADAQPVLTVLAPDLSTWSAAADRAPGSFDDVSCTADGAAAMLYTSGTTGRPKGAVLSHGNLAFSAKVLGDAWRFRASDVVLHGLPLFHTHGLFVALHVAFVAGAGTLLLPRFDAEQVVRFLPEATVFMGVPTHYARLLTTPTFTAQRVRHMRLFTVGSAPVTVAMHERFTERVGHRLVERYGMTETCILTTNPAHPDDGACKPGTVGRALPGVELRVTPTDGEAGSIEVRGPNVFRGYWHTPQPNATEFTSDGWFVTGDLGSVDADGYVSIVGRAKEVIITGGLNVYPREVELVLDALAGVAESAVFGVPHPDFGEAVAAAVTAAPGWSLDGGEVREAVRERLANFKVPKFVLVLDELPRNAMGKVRKDSLRALWEHTDAER
jgi:malonyl-CoA/methylmalonyl-CoA synthetase